MDVCSFSPTPHAPLRTRTPRKRKRIKPSIVVVVRVHYEHGVKVGSTERSTEGPQAVPRMCQAVSTPSVVVRPSKTCGIRSEVAEGRKKKLWTVCAGDERRSKKKDAAAARPPDKALRVVNREKHLRMQRMNKEKKNETPISQ